MSSAKSFKVSKGQMKKLLALLADSTDGRSASLEKLISIFGYDEQLRGAIREEQAIYDENMRILIRSKIDSLAAAVSNISRRMRAISELKNHEIRFLTQGDGYRATFVTRRLTSGTKSTARFGSIAPAGDEQEPALPAPE